MLQGGRKKAGRPIAYQGDPNDSRLTPEQRRKIRRRIANRESAQRVRARRAQAKGHFVKQAGHFSCLPSIAFLAQLKGAASQ